MEDTKRTLAEITVDAIHPKYFKHVVKLYKAFGNYRYHTRLTDEYCCMWCGKIGNVNDYHPSVCATLDQEFSKVFANVNVDPTDIPLGKRTLMGLNYYLAYHLYVHKICLTTLALTHPFFLRLLEAVGEYDTNEDS